jgi:hypothetical protein
MPLKNAEGGWMSKQALGWLILGVWRAWWRQRWSFITTDFLSFCIDCFFTTVFLYIFPRQMGTFLYVALAWFGNIYLGPKKTLVYFKGGETVELIHVSTSSRHIRHGLSDPLTVFCRGCSALWCTLHWLRCLDIKIWLLRIYRCTSIEVSWYLAG